MLGRFFASAAVHVFDMPGVRSAFDLWSVNRQSAFAAHEPSRLRELRQGRRVLVQLSASFLLRGCTLNRTSKTILYPFFLPVYRQILVFVKTLLFFCSFALLLLFACSRRFKASFFSGV